MNWLAIVVSVWALYFMGYSVYLRYKLGRLKEVSKKGILEIADAAKEAVAAEKIKTDDIAARYEEMRKVPQIACMTDEQVRVLAEFLAVHIREILEKKEYVN